MSRTKQILITVLFIVTITNITSADWRVDAHAVDISGGEDHTLVLTINRFAWACGDNTYDQLGLGDQGPNYEKRLSRVRGPDGIGYLEDVNDLDAGWKHSLALERYDPGDPNYKGYVWAWGDNWWGELGNNSIDPCASPIRVLRGAQAPADTGNPDPNLARIVDISAGRSGEHSLAVDANGFVYAWGRNQEGQCGVGLSGTGFKELDPNHVLRGEQPFDPNRPSVYLNRIISVSAGEWHSMALEAYDPDEDDPNLQGRVYTWGDNGIGYYRTGRGVLGNGSDVLESTTPVIVLSGQQDPDHPNDPLKRIVAVSAGWDHSMALEKYEEYDSYLHLTDPCYTWPDPNHRGRVYTWGNNGDGYDSGGGRLGNGRDEDSNSTPVLVIRGEQPADDPNDPYLSHIVAVSAGEGHSMALDVNGYVFCWGDNGHGQLGDGTKEQRLTPVKVVGQDKNRNGIHDENEGYLENIVAISAGYWHSLAIDANGVIWTWGKGSAGRLGLGDKTIDCDIPHPIPVVYNLTQETFAFAIQTAIDDANEGDVLEASTGIYYENVVLASESITLQSEDLQDAKIVSDTIVDARYNAGAGANYYYPAVDFNDSSGSTLAGLTLVNGTEGGVLCENVTSAKILYCSIHDNEWHGIRLNASSADIKNCEIRANTSEGSYESHGIYCISASDVNIANCVIADNAGSGILCQGSSLDVKNSFIADNDVNGISCQGSGIVLRNSVIEGNTDFGVYELCPTVSAVIANNIIRGNGDDGVCSKQFSPGPKIKNNWIYDNAGSGTKIWNPFYAPDSNAVIVNNTIVGNDEYGVESYYATDVNITSSIIWNNGSSPSDNLHGTNGTFTVKYSCIEGGYGGPEDHNINSDPRFVDEDFNNFHLGGGSPCIDTGDPDFEPEPDETDIDGEYRIINERVDMGADEFCRATDFNGDGLVNFVDYSMLARHWLQADTDAGYSDAFDLWDDDVIDFNDVLELCKDWLVTAECRTGSMLLMAGRSGGGMTEGLSLQVAPYELTAAEEKPLVVEPVDVKKLLDWLAEVWLDPEVRERIDAEAWLKLYESVKELE